jgi:hypothetical protein
VEAVIRSEPDFAGPDGRDWDRFESSGDEATFEWRTRNDLLRKVSRDVVDGRLRLAEALVDEVVHDWLVLRSPAIVAALVARSADRSGLAVEALRRLAFVEIGAHLDNQSPLGAYAAGDERPGVDAARALVLPWFAQVLVRGSAGFGAGALDVLVALEPSMTLDDLDAWLNTRSSWSSRTLYEPGKFWMHYVPFRLALEAVGAATGPGASEARRSALRILQNEETGCDSRDPLVRRVALGLARTRYSLPDFDAPPGLWGSYTDAVKDFDWFTWLVQKHTTELEALEPGREPS